MHADTVLTELCIICLSRPFHSQFFTYSAESEAVSSGIAALSSDLVDSLASELDEIRQNYEKVRSCAERVTLMNDICSKHYTTALSISLSVHSSQDVSKTCRHRALPTTYSDVRTVDSS